MLSLWRNPGSRIRAMGADELRTRVRQSISKRLDLLRYGVGFLPHSDGGNQLSLANGRFFFSSEELPRLARLLQEHCSLEVQNTVREANAVCRHHFRLLGYDDVAYGEEIDWQLDAVHGKRAPLKPGYRIPFLDFSVVGDHKVTWELNRHQHLVTLAKAWVLTGDKTYVAELLRQWYSWQSANPYPLGINWASTLEVAFRSMSWLWLHFLLAQSSAAPPSFRRDLEHALARHGSHIERYLSTFFSPNTHLLGEATALFFIGTLCSFSAAERWRNLGWRILLQEAERQVRSDGVYFEQSLHYHVYALDFFLHARTLAACNGIRIPSGFDATLERMLDVLHGLSQAGPPHRFGDDDGGRVFSPARNSSEHLTDPLAIGAVLFGRSDLATAASLTEEALWLFGGCAVSQFSERAARPSPRAASFNAGGIYLMASSEHPGQQLVTDAGPLGAGRGGHGHADALSVTLSLDWRHWLVDPGTLTYVSETNERDRFRGTRAHNTLTVDCVDQAVPAGPFAWGSLPGVSVERWLRGDTFTLFSGNHTGYCGLPDAVLHRRFVFHVHDGFWLVRDRAEGCQRHRLESSWHLAPDLRVNEVQGSFIVSAAHNGAESGTRLVLAPAQDASWTSHLNWDEVSPAYGKKESAPVLRISAYVPLPAECAMLIVPLLHGSDWTGKFCRVPSEETNKRGVISGFRFDEGDLTHHIIFGTGGESWALGPWTSDAELIYCSIADAKVRRFVLCNGSFAKLGERLIFAHGRAIERVEVLNGTDRSRVSASEDSTSLPLLQHALNACALASS